MVMPGRSFSSQAYRYGFNGKENDSEIKGITGSQQDYGFRIYDPRLGKFLSVDPLTRNYPELTPYQFASNRPLDGVDLDGLEFHSYVPILLYPRPPVVSKETAEKVTKVVNSVGRGITASGGYILIATGGLSTAVGAGGEVITVGAASPVAIPLVAIGGVEISLGVVLVKSSNSNDNRYNYYDNTAPQTESSKIEKHHSDPKFMGGEKNQELTEMTQDEHVELHKDLNNHLKEVKNEFGNNMAPSKSNPGINIRKNFTRSERLNAMSDFYGKFKNKYFKAAEDFFKQHPDLEQ